MRKEEGKKGRGEERKRGFFFHFIFEETSIKDEPRLN